MLTVLEFLSDWTAEFVAVGVCGAIINAAVGLWTGQAKLIVHGALASAAVFAIAAVVIGGHFWIVHAYSNSVRAGSSVPFHAYRTTTG